MEIQHSSRAVMYVDDDEASRQALKLLEAAGIEVEVRRARIDYKAIYGTPVLFGLHNKFEGLQGIRAFIDNAQLLGFSQLRR